VAPMSARRKRSQRLKHRYDLQVTFGLSTAMHEGLIRLAEARESTVSNVVRQAVVKELRAADLLPAEER
jgi:predicted transcriptional regulator